MTTEHYDFQFDYEFHNDSKLVYITKPNTHNVNFTNTYSFIFNNNSVIGSNGTFRIDGLIFLKISPQNNTQLKYMKNEIIQVNSNFYNTRVFEGNISTIIDCH